MIVTKSLGSLSKYRNVMNTINVENELRSRIMYNLL